MKKSFILISIILFVLFGLGYFYINSMIGSQRIDMTKTPFTIEQRIFIKKYFFPHKYYSQKIKTLNLQKEQISNLHSKTQANFQRLLWVTI